MAPDQMRRQSDNCAHHSIIEFKGNIALAFLGANLIGVLAIAIASGWAVFKVLPEFKAEVVSELSATRERAGIVEYKITTLEKVANKYMADVAEYEMHMKGSKP